MTLTLTYWRCKKLKNCSENISFVKNIDYIDKIFVVAKNCIPEKVLKPPQAQQPDIINSTPTNLPYVLFTDLKDR